MRFIPIECPEHSREVSVSYYGLFDDSHVWQVSSRSRPGLTHLVYVSLSEKFDITSNPTIDSIIKNKLVRLYSTDEFWKYSCAYNQTINGTALYPEFRAPSSPDHDYLLSHTVYAVLDMLCRLGPGVLETNFSKDLVWDSSRNCYSYEE